MRFLKAAPPEFLIFCFIEPLRGRFHRRLVSQPDSLMRRTAEYIRWLTHHPPRFELFADQHAALVRHIPTQQWPTDRIEHYARNFTIETLAWFRESGTRLALLTNGNGPPQRRKIERFGIERFFDAIFVEGEVGFGKPDERAYQHAMQALGVTAPETWMIGDNLEWEIEVPQRLGIYAIWMDAHGEGLPAESTVKPDRIIRSLTELLPPVERG